MRTRTLGQSVRSGRAKGTILIVTIWVVLVLAGLALVFARSMRVAAILSANHVAALECEYIASGACQYIISQLMAVQEEGETITLESDVPYEAMQVGNGYFWVLRSDLEDDQEFVFGLTDEAGKINLNSASEEMLLRLPGMTSELAASIIDWRDEDSEVTAGGAEDEYYLLLPEPYNCKNGPLETVEEILLIKGASKELLFGEDTNLNGILDDNENDGDESDPPDNSNGRLEPGFYDYVTVYTTEPGTTTEETEGTEPGAEGEAGAAGPGGAGGAGGAGAAGGGGAAGAEGELINVNDATARAALQAALEEFVSQDRALQIMSAIPNNPSYTSVLDFYAQSGMTAEEFEQIADRLTTGEEETRSGLVNVNTASKAVLLCLPELEEQDVDALISYRESTAADLTSVAWVANALDSAKATAIGSYITVNSYQYSADIICLSGNGRAYKRYRVVFDMQAGKPQIVYWKSMTHSGWPLEREIVATLKKGEPLTNAIVGMR
ncbi:MAG: general secretion pathway protein GspK [Sedimentisphaerales bacterium]|nr:general secretion pathway protein GspK [Sedimentisphaerales bacterium]